jgi:hypothetical protein
MDFNAGNAKRLLEQFNFAKLFIDELGWDKHNTQSLVEISGPSFALKAAAQSAAWWPGFVRERTDNGFPIAQRGGKLGFRLPRSRLSI